MLSIDDLVVDKEFEELLPVLTPEEFNRLEQSILKNGMKLIPTDEDRVILKKFYRVLANTYHPDNEKTGDADMMQYVNKLKVMWGI